MDPARFWQVTPRLVAVEIEGAHRRMEREQRERAWLAWTTALLPYMKKLPKFKDLVAPARPRNDAERVREFHAAWDLIDRALERAG